MQKHRKLAAIMFTDIVGYTALMSKDEESALRILQKNRDTIKLLVSQFNGEWLKEMGDGTLSSFGSVVDAVNCALEIQNALREESDFRLRIGIHIGDVVVEEGDVFGDGVNVASRIEKLAEPGGICVSGQVHDNVYNKPGIESEFLGEKTLKNVAHPVKIYCIKRVCEPAHFTQYSTPDRPFIEKIKPSIAVLPFIDMSPEKDQDYFCDGMAEEIINALTHVENLHVVARTSAFSFKGKNVKVQDIGKDIGVGTVLEGSVRKAGNRLRITAQLINVEDGYHLWSERFDRTMEDVFAIQDEISLAIVRELKVRLLKAEETAVVKRHTVDTEAYELYLKGLYYLNRRIEGGPKRGIEYFQQAIEKDPRYALAYVGIAHCNLLLGVFGIMPPKDAFSKVKIIMDKALEIDDMLAEAHALLAVYKYFVQWDFSGSEKEIKRAIELNPNCALAHIGYSNLLSYIGRFDESIAEIQRALQLDPLSVYQNGMTGFTYSISRRYNEAKEYYQKALEIDPYFPLTYWWQGFFHFSGLKMWEDAIKSFHTYMTLSAGSPFSIGCLGFAYGMAGQKDKASQLLEKLEKLSNEQYVSPYYKAWVYTGLGDKDQAFAYLEKAIVEREPLLVAIKVIPVFDSLRDDSRYNILLKKIGLPEN